MINLGFWGFGAILEIEVVELSGQVYFLNIGSTLSGSPSPAP